jgi:regulator of vacuolar morphogenesis
MKIDRVHIKGFKQRTSPEPHVAYEVEVSTKGKTWVVFHRFSDFLELHAALLKKHSASSFKESPPPKKMFGNNSPDVINERIFGLERYLKALLLNDSVAQDPVLYQFLDFEPPSKESIYDNIDASNWLERYQVNENLANSIAVHITNYERGMQQNGQNNEELMHAKKKIAQLNHNLANLGEILNSTSNITEKEMLRRRDMLSRLRIEKDGLQQRINHPNLQQQAASRNELMTSPNNNNNTNLNQRGPRVLGKVEETEVTRNLDDQGLIQLQKSTMNAQDQQLDELLSVVQRQAQIGLAINDELEYQNKLLDDLDAKVDNTRAKLKQTGKTLVKVAANA